MKKVTLATLLTAAGAAMLVVLKAEVFRFVGLALVVAGVALAALYVLGRMEHNRSSVAAAVPTAPAPAATPAPAVTPATPAPTAPATPVTPTAAPAPAATTAELDPFLTAVLVAFQEGQRARAEAEALKKAQLLQAEASKLADALSKAQKVVETGKAPAKPKTKKKTAKP